MQEPPEWVCRASQKFPTHLRSTASFENRFSLTFFSRKVYRKSRSKKLIIPTDGYCSNLTSDFTLLLELDPPAQVQIDRVWVEKKLVFKLFSFVKNYIFNSHPIQAEASPREKAVAGLRLFWAFVVAKIIHFIWNSTFDPAVLHGEFFYQGKNAELDTCTRTTQVARTMYV